MNKVIKLIKETLKDPSYLIILLNNYNIYHIKDDEKYIKICYKYYFKEKINLIDPKGFNEKLQWLKLHDRKEFYHDLVDKYKVRKYVSDKIGEKYLIPLLGVWNNFDDINFDEAPDRFVLKCTHDSGTVAVCNDKKSFNVDKVKKLFEKRMKRNFYLQNREWPYKGLEPKIIMEENIAIDGTVPDDYKLMCFSGKVQVVQYHRGRFSNHEQFHYDRNLNLLHFNNEGYTNDNAPTLDKDILKEMFILAEKIAKDFIHVRVDFYYVNNSIKFGEITFYDGAGFVPFNNGGEEYLGNLLDFNYKA